MHIRRIQATIIVGLLLLVLMLPQSALAAGPEISNVQVPDITFTTATITWTTNTTSDSRVNYGTVIPKDGTWKYVYDASGVTFHSIHLEDLEAGKTYYFEVVSTDGTGTATDNNGGVYYSFKTLIWYSITLDSACGVCGDLWDVKLCYEVIEVTAVVAAAGTYYICWDSCAAWNPDTGKGHIPGATFTASGAGTYTLTFRMPEAAKGDHTVYLTDNTYAEKDRVDYFEVRPSVKIYPEEGPVGTEVTLNGYGFDANKAFVIKFKDTVITKSTDKANSVGSWGPLSYTIPETPAGGYSFKSGPDADEVWVIEYFEVIPQITITDDDPDDGIYSGTVGQTIEVEGTGFQSEEEDIEVTFDEEEVQTYILPADDNGSWSAAIVIPTCQHGEHIIGASGKETSASDVDPVKFIVVAGILVEPDFACVGTPITVKGGGFAAGETGIKVTFDGTVKDSDITAEEDGTWESSFDLPRSTFGSHTVEASGDRTSAVTTTLDTKAKIGEPTPDEGSPGDPVRLTCSGFHGSQELTVTVGGVKVADSLQTEPNGYVVINFHVPKGSLEGKQPLMVTDEDGATHEEEVYFTVKKKTLSITPLPISPKGSTLRSGDVTFKWQGVSGDTGYTYTLEISTSADSGTIWSQPGIEGSSYTLTKTETVDETLKKGTYYWRVRMEDDYGNESAWSASSKFTVSPIPTWVWVVVGVVVLVGLMVVAYRETKFKIT